MAVGDLYQAVVRWQFAESELSSSLYYQQTGAGGDDLVSEDLAQGWWDKFFDGGGTFLKMLQDSCWSRSVYARKVPAEGVAQDEHPALYAAAPIVAPRPGSRNNPMDCLKIQAVAVLGVPAIPIRNIINVSGLSEDDIADGVFAAAFISGPVKDFTDALATTLTGPVFGATFEFVVARDPRGPDRAFAQPAQYRTSSVIGSMRRRQSETIGLTS